MGIPVYFKTLVSHYQDTILCKSKLNNIHSLFLDLNCLIHPCCHGLTDENEMIQKILFEITRLIDYTGVSELLYIAIDGIAPKGKMKQQRMRRYKSALERKYSKEKRWNTNAISPGTFFMKRLNTELKKYIQEFKIKIILSDSDERGEGEHKILHYIKNNELSGDICIYGLDADLIMLSLVSQRENIYLLRERTEYNIEDTESEFIYLKIDSLKNHIIDSLKLKRILDKKIIIDDYIFLCFLLGNDFMNHIPSLNLRYKGHDELLSIYSLLQDRYQGYFCLIDRKLPNLIHLSFFKEFIYELSLREKERMNQILSIRERQYKKIYNQYNGYFNDFKIFIMENNKNKNTSSLRNIQMEDIYIFHSNSFINQEGIQDDIQEMIENLPLLYSPNEKQIYNELIYNENLCSDYFDSLVWTTHYYFNECIDWRWATEFNEAPLVKYLDKFLMNSSKINFEKNNSEFSNEEQLSYIFPNDSHHLHEHYIVSKDYQMIVNLSFHRYLWECEIDFI